LSEGGGEMNWDVDTPMDWLGRLPGMDGEGGKPRVSDRKVVTFLKLFVFDLGGFLLINHLRYV
jgi:hypothetical protein